MRKVGRSNPSQTNLNHEDQFIPQTLGNRLECHNVLMTRMTVRKKQVCCKEPSLLNGFEPRIGPNLERFTNNAENFQD